MDKAARRVCQNTDINEFTISRETEKMNDSAKDGKLIKYETPQVITYTAEVILEELGPAQAMGSYTGANWPPNGWPPRPRRRRR
jgi:hypothetical protein